MNLPSVAAAVFPVAATASRRGRRREAVPALCEVFSRCAARTAHGVDGSTLRRLDGPVDAIRPVDRLPVTGNQPADAKTASPRCAAAACPVPGAWPVRPWPHPAYNPMPVDKLDPVPLDCGAVVA